MIGENRQLVEDEPVEVHNCRKITDHFRGIYRTYPNLIKEIRKMWTCNRLDLQALGSQPIMPKNLPDHCSFPLESRAQLLIYFVLNLGIWITSMKVDRWVLAPVHMGFQVASPTHVSKSQHGGKVPTWELQVITARIWLLIIEIRSWLLYGRHSWDLGWELA